MLISFLIIDYAKRTACFGFASDQKTVWETVFPAARYPKKPSRAAARARGINSLCYLYQRRAVADRLLEGQTPLKNVAHGLMRI